MILLLSTKKQLSIFAILIFTACQNDRRLSVMEQAGENRAELEKVLQYYKDDALKLKRRSS